MLLFLFCKFLFRVSCEETRIKLYANVLMLIVQIGKIYWPFTSEIHLVFTSLSVNYELFGSNKVI